MRNVNAKKHKETKKACISFGSIIFVIKYNLPLLQSNSKTLNKKKKNHGNGSNGSKMEW